MAGAEGPRSRAGSSGRHEERDEASRVEAGLPPGCAVVLRPDTGPPPPLHGVEAAAVAGAVARRRAEFAHGRAAARDALKRAGGPAGRIPVGPDRDPVWPVGWVGAITHCQGRVGAVVAPATVLRGVGLDAEVRAPLPADVVERVLHAGEVRAAARVGLPEVALFSAKESVHKAVFPSTRVWMDFLDVELEVAADRTFTARRAAGANGPTPALAELRGCVVEVSDPFVVTVAWLPVDPT